MDRFVEIDEGDVEQILENRDSKNDVMLNSYQ
jgi:hypothetical protein